MSNGRSSGGGLIGAIAGGFSRMYDKRVEREYVNAAAGRFRNIGTEEAISVAEMIEEDPASADKFVGKFFGGWDSLEGGLRERASRSKLGEKIGEMASSELAAMKGETDGRDISAREAYMELAPHIAEAGVTGFGAESLRSVSASFENIPPTARSIIASGVNTSDSAADFLQHLDENPDDMPGAMKKLKERRTPANAPRSTVIDGRLVTFTPEGDILREPQEIPGTPDWEVVGSNVPGGNLTERLVAHNEAVTAGFTIGSSEYNGVFKKTSGQAGKEIKPFKSKADYQVGQTLADNYAAPGAYEKILRAQRGSGGSAAPPTSPIEESLR